MEPIAHIFVTVFSWVFGGIAGFAAGVAALSACMGVVGVIFSLMASLYMRCKKKNGKDDL